MIDTPVSVCLISSLPPPYGGISHWTQMISTYAATQHEVNLCVVDIANRWRAVDDFSLWKRVLGGGVQLIRDTVSVLSQLLHRPHIIHLTTSGQLGVVRDLTVMACARLFQVPVIYHLHFGRIPVLAGGTSLEWVMLARAMRRAHTVVAIDGATATAIKQHLPEVTLVHIPNCIDVASLPAPTQEPAAIRTAVFLGWVIPQKGIEELMDAWGRIRPAGWRLHVVGPGNTAYQKQLLATYQPAEVTFFGAQTHAEAMTLLAAADLFVLPSYTEGFPNVVLEAMALEKPIIATRVGAIPEMLADESGLLVEPHDVEELVAALQRLFNDAALCAQLGRHARERAEAHYALTAIFAQYLAVWRHAAGLS